MGLIMRSLSEEVNDDISTSGSETGYSDEEEIHLLMKVWKMGNFINSNIFMNIGSNGFKICTETSNMVTCTNLPSIDHLNQNAHGRMWKVLESLEIDSSALSAYHLSAYLKRNRLIRNRENEIMEYF